MRSPRLQIDARYFQVIFQLLLLSYGLLVLDWPPEWTHYGLSIGGCLAFQYIGESLSKRTWLPVSGFDKWGFSTLISAMSLCLLLRTNHPATSLLAAFFTVASKYVFRWKGKHIFNPSAFGIVCTLLTGDAWLSPAQWGSNVVIGFGVVLLGLIVVTRVQKLDVSLAYLGIYLGLLFWRQVIVLGWPQDHFVHSATTGSLLLFSFFMISDPRTAPNHPVARIVWAILIALSAFYFAAFRWQYNTAIFALVAAGPLVPLLDYFFRAPLFRWKLRTFNPADSIWLKRKTQNIHL